MKKVNVLLLTSALVAGVASAAFAETAVKVGGKVESRVAFTDQKNEYETTGGTSRESKKGHAKMATTTKLDVSAETKTDAGLVVGAAIRLEDRSFNATNDNADAARIARSHVYFDSAMGRLELGNNDGASKAMKVDASDIARASGGVGGDFGSFANDQVGRNRFSTGDDQVASYLTDPSLLADRSSTYRKYNKVTYYTPEIAGFRLGVSYASDTENRGGLDKIAGKDYTTQLDRGAQVEFNDVITAGASYNYAIDNLAVKLAATGQWGKAKKYKGTSPASSARNQYRDLRAYNVGTVVSYANFSLAGSYGDNGKSGNTKETDIFNRNGAKYYTAGAAYVNGPVGLSVTHMSSKQMKNKFDLLSVGADYELAKGALAYVEGNFFKFSPEKGSTYTTTAGTTHARKNSGNVVLVGAKFAF